MLPKAAAKNDLVLKKLISSPCSTINVAQYTISKFINMQHEIIQCNQAIKGGCMSLKASTKIKVALWWDVANYSLAFMCIDNKFKILTPARKIHLDAKNDAVFQANAKRVVEDFYHHIHTVYQQHPKSDIKLEYKILHEVDDGLSEYYEPNPKSVYVKQIFLHNYALNKAKILPLRLSQQLRHRLKRPALDIFKKVLKRLKLVKPTRQNNYEYHLWILALHVTKTNYRNIIKKLYNNDQKSRKEM